MSAFTTFHCWGADAAKLIEIVPENISYFIRRFFHLRLALSLGIEAERSGLLQIQRIEGSFSVLQMAPRNMKIFACGPQAPVTEQKLDC